MNTFIPTQETQISELVPSFLTTARIDQTLTGESLPKYQDALRRFIRDMGDVSIGEFTVDRAREYKQRLIARGAGAAYINGVVYALRKFLMHCKDNLNLAVCDPKAILPLKIPRKAVNYLTDQEVEQFMGTVKVHYRNGSLNPAGLQFRTLVEVLTGTGMRISEALSLNITGINWERHEAKIIGKGGKERLVFFSERAIRWMKRWLDVRQDKYMPLFVSIKTGNRMTRTDAQRLCRLNAKKCDLKKPVTLHVLRHTFATTLLKNGCPIGHIQGLLGHERLETTCRYYLGMLDANDLKKAHERFLER